MLLLVVDETQNVIERGPYDPQRGDACIVEVKEVDRRLPGGED
jgi:hypothetical protein